MLVSHPVGQLAVGERRHGESQIPSPTRRRTRTRPEREPFLRSSISIARDSPSPNSLSFSLLCNSLNLSLERETETDSIAFFVHQLYQSNPFSPFSLSSFLSSHSILPISLDQSLASRCSYVHVHSLTDGIKIQMFRSAPGNPNPLLHPLFFCFLYLGNVGMFFYCNVSFCICSSLTFILFSFVIV